MTDWKLVKFRPCDGGCCVDSPRFPRTGSRFGANPNTTRIKGADCIYHLNGIEEPYGGCVLYKEAIGEASKKELLKLSDEELALFNETCLNWPLSVSNQAYEKIYTNEEKEETLLEFDGVNCCHRWEET